MSKFDKIIAEYLPFEYDKTQKFIQNLYYYNLTKRDFIKKLILHEYDNLASIGYDLNALTIEIVEKIDATIDTDYDYADIEEIKGIVADLIYEYCRSRKGKLTPLED